MDIMAQHTTMFCLIWAFIHASDGLQWESSGALPNGTTIPACSRQDVTLGWNYTARDEEHLVNVEWHFTPKGGVASALATHMMGSFFAVPSATQKLQFVPNAGLRLQNVAIVDSGTYSVHINLNVHGSIVTEMQAITVDVSDNLTTDGQLHLTMLHDAVYDNSTQQFYVQLACGDFKPVWGPHASVVWMMPSEKTLQSTTYANGRFLLSVPNPVTSGQYACSIDNASPAGVCVQGASPSARRSAISIDGVDARFILMEANMRFMKLKEENLETRHQQELYALKAQMDSTHAALRQENARMEQQLLDTISILRSKLEKAVQQVYFYAVPSTTKWSNYRLFDYVVHNVGNGYNAATGYFTAPVSGLYLFMVTVDSASYEEDDYVKVTLYVNNNEHMSALGEALASGSNQLVVHLDVGQFAYVALDHAPIESKFDSSFVGVLIQADI